MSGNGTADGVAHFCFLFVEECDHVTGGRNDVDARILGIADNRFFSVSGESRSRTQDWALPRRDIGVSYSLECYATLCVGAAHGGCAAYASRVGQFLSWRL